MQILNVRMRKCESSQILHGFYPFSVIAVLIKIVTIYLFSHRNDAAAFCVDI